MTEHSIQPAAQSGRKIAVVILAGVFLLLNVAALIPSLTSGTIFGDDALINLTSFLAVLAPIAFAAIIVFRLTGKPKIAALFLIPTAAGDILYTGWLLSLGLSPMRVLPLVSLSDFMPEWWSFSLLQAFEVPAIIALALLLLTSPKEATGMTPTYGEALQSSAATLGTTMTKASFCPKCGSPAGVGDFCAQCGNSLVGQQQAAALSPSANGFASGYPTVSTTSSMAVVAFVLSFFVPLVGLILGYVSRGEIDRSQGRLTGRGLATAAIVINWISIVVGIIWIIALVAAAASYSSY